jgi:hypothetical protein
MRLRDRAISRPSVIVAAAGLVAGALCAAYITPMALDSENRNANTNTDPLAVASTVSRLLADRGAGVYLSPNGARLMVPVTSLADARLVRRAGGVPQMVKNSGVDLANATRALSKATSEISGTGWARDPRTNKMVLWADESVRGKKLAKVQATAAQMSDSVRIERIPGKLSLTAAGGDAIFGEGSRCSLGFNVRQGDAFGFITAGHCGNAVPTWSEDQEGQQVLGNTLESSFPENDFALVQYENLAEEPPGTINLGNGQEQDITEAREAVVGEQVQRMGSTTGLNDGEVQQLDATVNFPEGTVTGMIRTNVCAEPGDSGGPLFAEGAALGITSGGNGDCQAGGTTFFQPITEPLEQFGVEVY